MFKDIDPSVKLDFKLKFYDHINERINKATLRLIKIIFKYLSEECVATQYKQ